MRVRVAIDLALDRLFDYEVPEALEKKLAVGQLLSVPFGPRTAQGFAIEVSSDDARVAEVVAPYQLKPIAAIVDETPFFSPALLKLVRRLADYTGAPIESMLKAALPAAVLKKNMRARELLYVEPALTPFKDVTVTKRQQWVYNQIIRLGGGWLTPLCRELETTPATLRHLAALGILVVKPRARRRDPLGAHRILPTKPLPLNDAQRAALDAITTATRPVLLHGVTGSGKTEVYLQAIARELAEGRGAIVMVPEIALTPQTVQRFASRFGTQVAVLHSALSDGERYDEWHRIRAGTARVVVGPRSVVFAPVGNLGLIVVDEEHETSYKQEDNPRYHARDAAVLRAAIEGAKVVLGSATPALESWMNVRLGKYALATMAQRAGAGTLPNIRVVDRRGVPGIFSPELMDAIRLRLDRGEQTILFLNRRGYSRSVICEQCGYVMACDNCSTAEEPLPYTYHRHDDCLRCHICGKWIPTPRECPNCHARAFTYKGIGTQRAEAALKVCFPKAAILRMDADATARKHSHDDILGAFRRGEADVLIGTQMIAKGLDFPNVTLVGVLNADSSLNMPDFRAVERTYQLLAQVSGRAGRAELPGEVIIQTYDPENDTIRAAARGDYAAFAARELKNREEGYYPPYCHLATVNLRAKDHTLVARWAEMYAASFKKVKGLEVSDAMPSALDKAEGWYRWQIVLRARTMAEIVRAWRWLVEARKPPAALRISLDADAYNMI